MGQIWDALPAYGESTDLLSFEPMQSGLSVNLIAVRERIDASCRRTGRDPGEVKLVAVSKTHPAAVINEAITAGMSVFGENKVQEAESKILKVGRTAAEWHLIGHLQSNKTRKAVALFDVIHSVDSVELAGRLDRICIEKRRDELSVFVQVDLAGEETKSGIGESDLPELVDFLKTCKCLKFDGLMVLPPYFDEPEATRPFFQKLRAIRDRLAIENAFANGRGELSMGMSNDFEIALEEGATVIRVGTAIFGGRQYM
jgi:pyridoxal phosphate enzyme (YggS family)